MAIEIRELRIKVKIEEEASKGAPTQDLEHFKQMVLKECKKEIRKQLGKHKER
ncbi:MAG: DUF5908 family protein [Bacteroidota bacterium]